MTVPSKTFPQFVQDMITFWGGAIGKTPQLSAGSMLLSVFESTAAQLDFLQAEIQAVVALARAATSTGADLDTWMADFNFGRLPATFAVGPVVLQRNTPAAAPIGIPAAQIIGGTFVGGGLVQTIGGAVSYQLIPDTAETSYNATSNTYQFPIGASSITVTAQSVVSGSSANVSAGALSQIGSQMAGVDTVTNIVPIGNGVDAESDANFRARFILFLSTLAKATKSAILAAAGSVQQGLQIVAQENVLANGTPQNGSFTVFVDDGTGAPPQSLLTSVFAAVDAVRGFSIQPFVVGPNIQNATIVLAIRPAGNSSLAALQAPVAAAIAAVVEQLITNQTLFVSAVEAAALSVPGVLAVQSGTTINGITADLVPAPGFEVRTNTGIVAVGSY